MVAAVTGAAAAVGIVNVFVSVADSPGARLGIVPTTTSSAVFAGVPASSVTTMFVRVTLPVFVTT